MRVVPGDEVQQQPAVDVPGDEVQQQPAEAERWQMADLHSRLAITGVAGAGILAALAQAEDAEGWAVILGGLALACFLGALWARDVQRRKLYGIALILAVVLVLGGVAVANVDHEREAAEPEQINPPKQMANIAIGGQARAAAAATDGQVWVIGLQGRPPAGTLSRIDPQHFTTPAERIESFRAKDPFDIDVGEGAIWITDNDALIKLDLKGRFVWRRSYGRTDADNEVEVAFGRVWLKRTKPGKLLVLDPLSGRVLETVPIGPEATAIAAGLDAIWVSSRFEQPPSVVRVEPHAPHRTTQIAVQDDPEDLTAGERYVWIAHAARNVVTRIDPRRGKGIELPGELKTGGDLPSGIAAGAGAIWVANANSGDVTALDPCDGSRLGSAIAGDSPYDVAVDQRHAFVPSGDGTLRVFRLSRPPRRCLP